MQARRASPSFPCGLVRRIARFFLDLFHQFLDSLAFACNIHEAAALVNEGIREQADKARFRDAIKYSS